MGTLIIAAIVLFVGLWMLSGIAGYMATRPRWDEEARRMRHEIGEEMRPHRSKYI
ncbi:MAG: hypothetical protein ACR2PS_11805 [Pseudomonadales bacterium]